MVVLAVVIGYLIGSIPWGYLVGYLFKRGDIRDYGWHNLGFDRVIKSFGILPASLVFTGDVLKGFIMLAIAKQLAAIYLWADFYLGLIVLATTIGAICSAYFLLRDGTLEGGRGMTTGFGLLLGLEPLVAGYCLIFWLIVLEISRYISLASLLTVLTVPIWLFLFRQPTSVVICSTVAAAMIALKHLASLQKIFDQCEPKIGQNQPPVNQQPVICAFHTHPLDDQDWQKSTTLYWLRRLAKRLSIWAIVQPLAERFCPAIVYGEINLPASTDRPVRVIILGVPLRPATILADPALAIWRSAQAGRLAHRLGARIIGLGAFNSIVSNSGLDVVRRVKRLISVTNGGALTAGTARLLTRQLIETGRLPNRLTIAVLGAYGVVGTGVCYAIHQLAHQLILIGRREKELANLVRGIEQLDPDLPIQSSTNLDLLIEADLIIAATSSPEPLIRSEHLKPGAVVIDFGRPSTIHGSVFYLRQTVTIFRGGDISIPLASSTVDLGSGPGKFPACLVETILIAVYNCPERATLAKPKPANIEFFLELLQQTGLEVDSQPIVCTDPRLIY